MKEANIAFMKYFGGWLGPYVKLNMANRRQVFSNLSPETEGQVSEKQNVLCLVAFKSQ